ncbi:hypothetical protein Tco_0526979 [Tanacetum coccineum]
MHQIYSNKTTHTYTAAEAKVAQLTKGELRRCAKVVPIAVDQVQRLEPRVWKSVRYGVSKGLDTAYWIFLEHGYAVSSLMDTAYWSSE